MTVSFYQAGILWQAILLVVSQFAVIALAAGFILLFRRKSKLPKIIGMGILLLLNVLLYVLMQLDSRITGMAERLHLCLPYAVLAAATVLSLVLGTWMLLSETKNRKTINHRSIKEAFDNLPTGVCFFNQAGLPVLCNPAMQRFSFAICGKDVQFITDLESCLDENFKPAAGIQKAGKVFVLPGNRAWHLEKRVFTYDNNYLYTQYVAADVTELHRNRVELVAENDRLREVQTELKKLSANVMTVTREEEILNTKMRVHDEMGRCLMETQKYLRANHTEDIPGGVIASWQRAVSMLKYSNDTQDEDMLLQIRKTCEYVKLNFVQTGELPEEEHAAYLLTCAVRECVTNAVRYADATELYADFAETESEASVTVTNNGKVPDGEIKEGGGLSTLRRRVERADGTMTIRSRPIFQLTVTIPKRKAEIL